MRMSCCYSDKQVNFTLEINIINFDVDLLTFVKVRFNYLSLKKLVFDSFCKQLQVQIFEHFVN